MLLCLDIGNTHIYGGLFDQQALAFQFRYSSKNHCTSDEFAIFLKTYLREIDLKVPIKAVAFCSVVPSLDYSICSAFIKYFSLTPFALRSSTETGLKIQYQKGEIGTDRIANAIAAHTLYPQENLIIVDLGTATTFEVISAQGEFLGGAIIPGLQMQMRALHEQTANLPRVSIVKRDTVLGQSTITNIQSGLYYGQRGAIREILVAMKSEFQKPPVVIGTGGFAHLFEDEKLFNVIISDLVLQGLRMAYQKNTGN